MENINLQNDIIFFTTKVIDEYPTWCNLHGTWLIFADQVTYIVSMP